MEAVRGVTCTPGFLLLGAALVLLDGEGVLPWAILPLGMNWDTILPSGSREEL